MSNITKYFYMFCHRLREPYSITLTAVILCDYILLALYTTVLYILSAKIIIFKQIWVETSGLFNPRLTGLV